MADSAEEFDAKRRQQGGGKSTRLLRLHVSPPESVSVVALYQDVRIIVNLRRVLGKPWAYRLRGALVAGDEEELRQAVCVLFSERIFRRCQRVEGEP
jgi:hypothetical protein